MISISLIVVLLASYSYSLPVPPQIHSSTPQIPFTTGETSDGISSSTNGYLFPGSQTTSVSSMQPETTTLNPHKVQGHGPRGIHQSTVLTSTVPLSTSSHAIVDDKLNQFSSTTMETKASFHKKAIDGETADFEEEQTESKRAVSPKYVRPSSTISYSTPISSTTVMNGIIGHTSTLVGHTSSPQSFGKITGQMKNKRGEYYEQDEQKREFDQEQQDEQQDEQKREFDHEQQDEQQDEQKREFNEEQQDEQQDEQKREFNEEQQDEQQDEQKREFNDEQQDEQQDEQKREFDQEQQDEQQDEQKREFDQEQQDEQQDEQKREYQEKRHHKQRKPYSKGQPSYEKGGSNYGEKQSVGDKTKSNY